MPEPKSYHVLAGLSLFCALLGAAMPSAPDKATPAPVASAEVQTEPPALGFGAAYRPGRLELSYHWLGYSPIQVKENYSWVAVASKPLYQVSGTYAEIKHSGQLSKSRKLNLQQPDKAVAQLIKALLEADWKPAKEPAARIGHTDDYPHYSLHFDNPAKQSIRLFSDSNTEANLPWNLELHKQLYLSESPALGEAVAALFKPLRQ